jgi:type IV pilus assembly protein PilW
MKPKHLQGFTLTEIMVALVISSILMGGVITIMSSSKRTYALQNEMAELQDNARFVMEELTRELRMGGFFGCSENPPDSLLISNPFQGSQNDQRIVDEEGDKIDSSFPNSDILSITSFSQNLSIDSTTALPPNGNQITLLTKPNISPTQIIVSNCISSAIYPVASINDLIITTAIPFQTNYLPPVEVFVGTTTVTYQVRGISEGGFALFKCDNIDEDGDGDPCDLLVEGVQNIQIRYGIDMGSGSIQYNNFLNGNVRSVRITWLMRTVSKRGIGKPPGKTFYLDPSVSYNPSINDLETGYRHRLFSTTVKVRN